MYNYRAYMDYWIKKINEKKKAHRIKGKRIKMPMWKEREGNIKRR
jgi:hypothetical protein